MNPGFLPFILVSLIILVGIPICASQTQGDYETCRQPFNCGNSLRNISYPFYGGNRPPSCGYPGYELDCQDGVPMLNMLSVLYRVVGYNNQTRTVRVARNDLWNTICPPSVASTTLNTSLFNHSSTASDQNITLFYGCTLPTAFPNQFDCRGEAAYFFTTLPSTQINCSTGISVWVTQTAAAALATVTIATASNVLQTSLQGGFSIQWSADGDNCTNCVESGGSCGFDQTTSSSRCFTQNQNGSNQGGLDPKKIVIIGGSVCISILVILSFIVHYYKKRTTLHSLDRKSNQHVEDFLLNYGSLAPKRYSYSNIKKMTKSFTDKLGRGGYGILYKGELPDGQLVAVKVLTESSEFHDNAEEFMNEVSSISRTSHVNIVNLLGFCYDRKRRALVYEYMPNKSLDKFIYKHRSTDPECSLELDQLYAIALGVARGLEYLHRGCNTSIVHFDIKPQNILLDENFCPKISDFGLAKLFKQKQSKLSVFGARGTIGYIAPEVFSRNFGVVSYKSDFYSYGMMLLEMGEARRIFETEPIKSTENYFHDKIYEYVLLKSRELCDLTMEEKEENVRKMLMVGIWCIQTAPSERPSMSKVVEMLEGSLQSIRIPPKPVFPSPPQLSESGQFSSSSMI